MQVFLPGNDKSKFFVNGQDKNVRINLIKINVNFIYVYIININMVVVVN